MLTCIIGDKLSVTFMLVLDVTVSNLINYFSAYSLLEIKTYCNFQRVLLNKWGKMSKGGTAASLHAGGWRGGDGCWRLQAEQPTDNVRRMMGPLVVVASCKWYNTTHACMPMETYFCRIWNLYRSLQVYVKIQINKENLNCQFRDSVTYGELHIIYHAHTKIWLLSGVGGGTGLPYPYFWVMFYNYK